MIWNRYRIIHAQTNHIHLYCRQSEEMLELIITNEENGQFSIFIHDFLIGHIRDLFLDQHLIELTWEQIDFDFEDKFSEFDMENARAGSGYRNEIDYIKYHIANAINRSFSNRSFSRYLKKNIIGKWHYKALCLSFYEDGTFEFDGKPSPSAILAGVPERGTYQLSRNMIHFWGTQNSGLRLQVVDLRDGKLILPGFSGKLFFVLTKKHD